MINNLFSSQNKRISEVGCCCRAQGGCSNNAMGCSILIENQLGFPWLCNSDPPSLQPLPPPPQVPSFQKEREGTACRKQERLAVFDQQRKQLFSCSPAPWLIRNTEYSFPLHETEQTEFMKSTTIIYDKWLFQVRPFKCGSLLLWDIQLFRILRLRWMSNST